MIKTGNWGGGGGGAVFTAIQSYMEKTVWFDANGWGVVGGRGGGGCIYCYPTLHEADMGLGKSEKGGK